MKRKTYILTSLFLAAIAFGAAVWNFNANTVSAQEEKAETELGNVVVGQTEYNATTEFSLTQGGTSGVWFYGYTTSDASNAFVQYTLTNPTTDCGFPADVWRFSNTGNTTPVIVRYQSPTGCQGTPPESLFLHPESDGKRSVLRWVAPAAGTYQLTGALQRANPIATTEIRILKNETESLFTGSIVSTFQQAFNVTVTVAANDTIDFSVGFGNGSFNGDSSALNVTVGQPITSCLTAPANLQVFVPGENSPSDVQSVNTNASLVGDAAYTNMGKVGRAFTLDGTDDYVRIEDNAAQRPATAVTTEGWFKFNAVSGVVSLISKPIRDSNLNSYTLYLDGGQLRGIVGNASQFTRALSNFSPQTGVWHHLAFTYDLSGGVSTLKLYANGVEVTSGVDGTANLPISYDANPYPLLIGGEFENNVPGFTLNGQADEVSVYGRALAQTEIFDIVQQGSFGKCAPGSSCLSAPQGLVSFYKGEDNALDSNSPNPGTLQNGATFGSGRVGRAFNFPTLNDFVSVPDSPALRPTNLTVEGWFNFSTAPTGIQVLASKNAATGNSFIIYYDNGFLRGQTSNGAGTFGFPVSIAFAPTVGQWYHIAYTWKSGGNEVLYIGGVAVDANSADIAPGFTNNPFTIGAGGGFSFQGRADEVSIYNRAITATEVSSIFNAGANGKCLAYTCVQSPNNLVSWFAGEQNALDSKSNNHGTNNGATFATGKVGEAFNLNGTSHIAVPDNPSLDFGANQDFSIETWIRVTAVNATTTIIEKRDPNNNFRGYVLYLWDNGRLTLQINDGIGFGNYIASSADLRDAQWHHVAVSVDRDNLAGLKFYVDGTLVDTQNPTGFQSDLSNGEPFFIGKHVTSPAGNFVGQIDEVGIYRRALSTPEISSIYNAGSSGKCKPVGLNPAANQIAWFTGDGETVDFTGLNPDGVLQGDASYKVGRVGQSFNFDGNGDFVEVANNANLNPTATMTLESWVYKTNGGDADIAGKDGENSDRQYWLGAANNSKFRPHISTTNSGLVFFDGATAYNLNTWYHVAMTYDGATVRLYVNGVLDGSIGASGSIITTTQPFRIGGGAPTGQLQQFFTGKIDEVSLYDRALTASEIAAVYNAGTAGKLKSAATPVNLARTAKTEAGFAPTTVNLSSATVTFAQVTTAGTTSQSGLDLGLHPALPSTVTTNNLNYDLLTTAAYTGNVTVCFNVPSIPIGSFTETNILHLENGAWVNSIPNTTTRNYPTICGDFNSLSPFVVVQGLAPTAASVTVSGRLTAGQANGVPNAFVSMTDQNGEVRTTRSNSFGYYRFDDVQVGQIYIFSAHSKQYQFPIQVVSVMEEMIVNLTVYE